MIPADQDAFAAFLAEFGRFREDNQREHGQLRADSERRHGELRVEMHKEFNSHLRWIIGTIGGMGVAVLVAIVTSTVYIAGRLP